jgi:hypothetical protein
VLVLGVVVGVGGVVLFVHGQHCNLQIGNVLEQLIVAFVFVGGDVFDGFGDEDVKGERAQAIDYEEDDDEDDGLDFDFGELFADLDLFDLFVEVGVLDLFFLLFICTERGVVLEGVDLFHAEFLFAHLLVFLAQVDEKLHCILGVAPGFFNVSL